MRIQDLIFLCGLMVGCSSEPASTVNQEPAAPLVSIPDADLAALEEYKLEIREKLPEIGTIEVDELARRVADGTAPLLIDVRAEEEFAVSHLPGARRAEELEEALALLQGISREREIVVYCSIGYRSGYLAEALQNEGFNRIRNLEGSIFEWANEGHSVYRGTRAVKQVHPYNKTWGRLLDSSLWSESE